MQNPSEDQSLISGSVERITYHNEENGFCIIRVKAKGHRDFVTVKGKVATIHAGEFIEGGGEWINDRNYGMQFQSKWLRVVPPTTLEGIQKYLGSGMIKGIGSHFSKILVKAFGEDVFSIIEDQPERLHSLPGIGKKRINIITKAWEEQKVVRSIMIFLQSNGVGTARAVRIYKTYGEDAIAIVSDNPYRLALDIRGIGFKTADELALRLGIPQDSVQRAQAGVRHVLQEICSEGHCAAQEQHLIEKSVELLAVPVELIRTAIEAELQDNRIIREMIDDMPCIYLDKLYHAENSVAQQITRLIQGEQTKWSMINIDDALQKTQQQVKIQLSPSQHKAVVNSLHNKVSIITGGPGVGKTTVVNTIIKVIHSTTAKVTLCAPTGRAAKRLSESTSLEAKTIHRLLEFNPSSYSFKYNRDKPLDTDFLVCDEASMIDLSLMNSLLKAIPSHASVLIVGDIDQLPSVGSGAVLSDMIESGVISTARLTDIFRQAKTSRIIVNAHRINEGKAPFESIKGEKSDFFTIHAHNAEDVYNKLIKVVTKRLPQAFNLNPIDDIQILTPMNRAGLGAKSLNLELQKALNGHSENKITKYGNTFAVGDKIIQTVNNYDKDVFNGDLGRIKHINHDESEVKIDFDNRSVIYDFNELDEIDLAYATTIHKSQGSEYPAVVIPLAMQHYTMLQCNLLYTGVTRGKQLVVLVGEKKAIFLAAKNKKTAKRITNLKMRLAHSTEL